MNRQVEGPTSLIFSQEWEFKNGKRNKGYAQSKEHIRLIEEEGFQLLTFPMTAAEQSVATEHPRIRSFEKQLTAKSLIRVGGNCFVSASPREHHPKQIPEGIQSEHLLKAISLVDTGVLHHFAESTAYDLLHNGKRYPPKAIVGIAAEVLTGVAFGPEDFKGGLESKCFRILKSNGFEIVLKLDEAWTQDEIKAFVVTYLEIQKKQGEGEEFTKKSNYQTLADRFGLTIKTVEQRMQNISYVLSLHGRDWTNGLNPANNVDPNVAAEIESTLAEVEGREAAPFIAFEAEVQRRLGQPNIEPPKGEATPKKVTSRVSGYERLPSVKAWVLQAANGTCENCEQPAPFMTARGQLFLEVHHVRSLGENGSDRIENAVAICPNCHRALHHSRDKKTMLKSLFSRITRLVQE